jgi:hypothetical protein
MRFYLIRVDLTGFQHVHPTMTGDGTRTAPLTAAAPGSCRLYATFMPARGTAAGMLMVLGRRVCVPGRAVAAAPPGPSNTTSVDGYTLTAAGP